MDIGCYPVRPNMDSQGCSGTPKDATLQTSGEKLPRIAQKFPVYRAAIALLLLLWLGLVRLAKVCRYTTTQATICGTNPQSKESLVQ